MRPHTFHIPVMGIGFTIDTPLKVSHLGIDSVISLVDDILLEKLRKMYCNASKLPYKEITNQDEDHRAKRITSYLNLMHDLAEEKIEKLKSISSEYNQDLKQYLNLLPNTSSLKSSFKAFTKRDSINNNNIHINDLPKGSIDVNIMTKVDKENYKNDEKLPTHYNDAHAALRGFANSKLNSSVILSAGMNPRLFSYMEDFNDFYPNLNGNINKKIVLKVSDYRSALIQGKILAKKGLWVSEYRIESGLNCGGHAFATDGYLIGPILAQFRDHKAELIAELHELLIKALENKNHPIPKAPLSLKITAQGGVGTAEEHAFLLDHYKVDSVGWGSPFLLVPEATTVDNETLNKLKKAKEKDLYLSNISPLGIPFNSLKGNTKDEEKHVLIERNKPGSVCPKRYVALNKEFSDKGMCTASREYQYNKIKHLKTLGLSNKDYQKQYQQVVEKSCACVGLGTSALLKYNLDTKKEGKGVSVCPGPNLAYFSNEMSLQDMTNHIYGTVETPLETNRPNMFIKELSIYLNYLNVKIEDSKDSLDRKQKKHLGRFVKNLSDGIEYYEETFKSLQSTFINCKQELLSELEQGKQTLKQLNQTINTYAL